MVDKRTRKWQNGCNRGWAAVIRYLKVSFGTTGARRGHLVLPGVTWSVTWCYLGVAWCYLGLYFGVVSFFCGPKISAFLKLKLLEKINFHLEMLPGPTLVVVTCLPGPLSGLQCQLQHSTCQNAAALSATCGGLR